MKMTKLVELIRETINEELELESKASDDAKRQGLEYMSFGRWGKDGKITHTTQGGKLVPLASMDRYARTGADGSRMLRPRRTPDQQRRANKPLPDREAEFDSQEHDASTPAGNKIVAKVENKFFDTQEQLLDKYDHYEDIPADEFTSVTGIPKKAAIFAANNFRRWEEPFSYDAETDTFAIHDPMDI
jgi:hypothetical protein